MKGDEVTDCIEELNQNDERIPYRQIEQHVRSIVLFLRWLSENSMSVADIEANEYGVQVIPRDIEHVLNRYFKRQPVRPEVDPRVREQRVVTAQVQSVIEQAVEHYRETAYAEDEGNTRAYRWGDVRSWPFEVTPIPRSEGPPDHMAF